MRELCHLPLSGQIIGEAFDILRICYPDHLSKEMQRYFRGERIHDDYREQILYVLADALIKDRIIPYPPVFKLAFICDWALKKQLVRGISEYTERWDSICAKLRYWAIPKSQKEELFVSCLRLVTIDLALRWAAFRYLSRLPPPDQAIPFWAKRDGNVSYLKRLKERCNAKPSNAEMMEAVGVRNDKTKAEWFYKGRRPSRQHIEVLAGVFAERIPDTVKESLFAEMNRHYVLAELCSRLANQIGWDRVMDLVGTLHHQTARLQRFFEQDPKPVEENYSRYLLRLTLGIRPYQQDTCMEHLWHAEKDSEWKQDIVCVGRDWVSRLIQVNLRSTGESILNRHHENGFPTAHADYISAAFIDHVVDGETALWGGAGPEAYGWDEKAEVHFRRAIRSKPDSARAHLNLGVFLGIHSAYPSQGQEGFNECCRAAELEPKWDLPRIEAANILLRVGKYREALAHLGACPSNMLLQRNTKNPIILRC